MWLAAHGFRTTDPLRAAVALYAHVALDGEPIHGAVFADEEAGTVEVARRDADGRLLHENGRRLMETLRGAVSITLPDTAPEATRRCYDILRAREAGSGCLSGAIT